MKNVKTTKYFLFGSFVFIFLLNSFECSPNRNKKQPLPDIENLEGQLLHDNLKFNHSNNDKLGEKQKLNITDPSENKLEENIKISGHENETIIQNKKLNVSEPSTDDLESQIKVRGHKLDESQKNVKINVSEPSLESLVKKIKVKGHRLEKPKNQKIKNMEPNIETHLVDQKLLLKKSNKTEKINITNIDPSINFLENQIKIDHNETTEDNNLMFILPGYEGFHGAIVHGDESYQHKGNGSDETDNEKVADLDDYKKWLENEAKESKLTRFQRLHKEFTVLDNKMGDHDQHVTHKEHKRVKKLEKTIKEIEEIESKQKSRKHRMDL